MVSDNRYFNLLSVICFKIDGIYPMKNQEIQTTHSKGSLAKGLFALGGTWAAIFLPAIMIIIARSEERRVGKECRSGWSPAH